MVAKPSPISTESIQEELNKILSSSLFANVHRSRDLLKFVVERALNQQGDRLKEYTLGVEALGRGDAFDPRTDPIVRAEASRLRSRLDRYYAAEGSTDVVEIALPKGSYVPQFLARDSKEQHAAAVRDGHRETYFSRRAIWIVASVFAVAALAGIGILVSRRTVDPPAPQFVQFDIELKAKGVLASEVGTDVVISPDGTRFAYITLGSDGVTHLNTRRLDQPQAISLPETENARGPFFSPDSKWIGFSNSGKLKSISVDGGSPTTLCDSADSSGMSWGQDGQIIAAQGTKLLRIPATGGQPTAIADLATEAATPRWPQVLPGGQFIIFTSIGFAGPDRGTIEALSLSTGKRSVLARGGTFGRYLPNGYVTYVNQGTLFALPYDIDHMEARGSAVPILTDVAYSSTFGFAQMDFSQTGDLVYRKSNRGEVIAEWLDAAGKRDPLLIKSGRYLWPTLSPDGGRVAFSMAESGTLSVGVYEQKTGRTSRLEPAGGPYFPVWSPNGDFLVLGGTRGLSWLRPDNMEKEQPLTQSRSVQVPWSFSPDGKRLAYHELNTTTGFDLWTVPIEVSKDGLIAGKPEVFLQSPAFETYPAFSPDGSWMAYASNESGSWEVYVRAFPDNGTKVQISTNGGRIARWSRNGRELFYRTDDQRIMVATYSTQGGRFSVRPARQWSQVRLADTGVLSNFDLSADGRRILALMPAANPEDQQSENHVTFVQSFFDEVQRQVVSVKR